MTKRFEAQLVDWNDARGFGFARLPGGTERVFVHIKALEPAMPRPRAGDQLELELVEGKNGKPAARHVAILSRETGRGRPLSLHLATAAILLLILQLGLMMSNTPLWLAGSYVFMGAMSMVAYSWDKRAAQLGVWRVSEGRLIAIDALGGVIGGLIAQHMFKHKRHKGSYQTATLWVVAGHAALLAAFGAGLFGALT